MLNRLLNRLSFANIVSLIALFVALGGTSIAAISLSKNSVGSKQIKPKAVRASDLARNAVRSPAVKNRSLRAVDFALGQLPAGPQGPQGPQGSQGPPGEDATAEAVVRSAFAAAVDNALIGVPGNALTTTIDAPTSGYLFVFAGSDVFNYTADDFVDCLLEVNDVVVPESRRSIELNSTSGTNREENCATNGTVAVSAGTHTVNLVGTGVAAGTGFDEATLQVLFVPLGADGSQP